MKHSGQDYSNKTKHNLSLPTKRHLEWADCEIGVIIHMDIQVFEPTYRFREQRGYHPDPKIVNPANLDTDQWLETAESAGAKYAVLVAKHCSGFSLWPTKAHGYSVAQSPWRNGKGDIVGDFIKSCQKYGIRPGLYYSSSCNAFCNVDSPGKVLSGNADEQRRYNEIVVQQLTELWANYGEIFEIWFDGGTLPVQAGGPDIISLLRKYQPDAAVFQGPKDTPTLIRWVGNERGGAPYPCWSTARQSQGSCTHDGTVERKDLDGDPEGDLWVPAETDMPNRRLEASGGGWMWGEGDDQYLYPVDHLVECYYTSVGRNTNLLLGMVIDNRGLVPDADVRQFMEFGFEIRKRFEKSLAETSGAGESLTIDFSKPAFVDQVVTMEDIAGGERVRNYIIEGYIQGRWKELCAGISIGHKRIDRFLPIEVSKIRWRCTHCADQPSIRRFAVYHVGG